MITLNWDHYHSLSESFANTADSHKRLGKYEEALSSYLMAAQWEIVALNILPPEKTRTIGITLISAVSLLIKAGQSDWAKDLSLVWIQNDRVPDDTKEALEGFFNIEQANTINND
jgi:hypothetical protein